MIKITSVIDVAQNLITMLDRLQSRSYMIAIGFQRTTRFILRRILRMFSITRKIAIAASFLAFSSAYFGAIASNSNNDEFDQAGKQLVVANPVAKRQLGDEVTGPADSRFQNGLPVVVMKMIFHETSKLGVDPRILRTKICKYWAHAIRYVIPLNGPATIDNSGIPYINPNNDNFMEDCMNLYMDGIVSRGVLYYKRGEAGKEQVIRFSDSQDGTASLADCEDQDNYQVYTLDEIRASLVRGANEDKLVTYVSPFLKGRHLLPADAAGKGRISDVVVIWRWGNDPMRPDMIAYLIINPALLGRVNMFENGKKSAGRLRHRTLPPAWCGAVFSFCCFHVYFVNQNQDYRQEPVVKKPRV